MSDVACSLGCFVCGNQGDGPATGRNAHDSSCCKSTRCNSTAWKKQVEQWLLAEQLWGLNLQEWLAAEQLYEQACRAWLQAQQQFRVTLRARSVKRVRVAAQPATPQTAKVRAHAR